MKKIAFFVILIFSLFIINNFLHSIYALWQKQDLITQARKELGKARTEHKKLQSELRTINEDPNFVEKEARNKLFLVKPGEQVIVLPELSRTTEVKKTVAKQKLPVWQQWYTLFFD